MKFFKRDPFGKITFFKQWLITILGLISYRRFNGINKLNIKGGHVIKNLPNKNVLFISNHQTYFADVTAMIHVFNASLKGRENSLKNISYLLNPKLNIYFIAAKETMQAGIIPKILAYTGAITISRTWRSDGQNIKKRPVEDQDINQIKKALSNGWLITFPQGTTKPWSEIRKGTAHIIKDNKPLVIPITIDGFRRSFDKTGLMIKKKGVKQQINIKEPLNIDYTKETIEEITNKISIAIEQHPSFR